MRLHTRVCAFVVLTLLLVLPCAEAYAARVEARSMSTREGRYDLRGDVIIEREGRTLRADEAVYVETTGLVNASGNVVFEDGEVRIAADSGIINILEYTGALAGAEMHVNEGNYNVRADVLRINGEGSFTIERASVTTCTGLPPAWCVSGSRFEIQTRSFEARHATLRLHDIPVFYTPYLWAPIVTERTTGLLVPTLGYRESTGFYIDQPFFWAIAVNQDATLALDYRGSQAFGQSVEYRYMPGPLTSGEMLLAHMRDNVMRDDYYLFHLTHRHAGPGRIRGFVDLNTLNIPDYFQRYESYVQDSSRRMIESRAEIYTLVRAKGITGARAYIRARTMKDLAPSAALGDEYTVMPEAGYYQAPAGFGTFTLSGEISAAGFANTNMPDVRRSRVTVRATHFMGRGPTFSQEASATHEAYESSDGADGHRILYAYNAEEGAILERTFGSWRSSIEPAVGFSERVVFGRSGAWLDGFMDNADSSTATLGIGSRLFDPIGREVLHAKLVQPYDVSRGGDKALPLVYEMTLNFPSFTGSLRLGYDHLAGELAAAESAARYTGGRVEVFGGQSYSNAGVIETYTGGVGYAIHAGLRAEVSARYDAVEERGLEESMAALAYTSQCWGMRAELVRRPGDYNLSVKLNLLGLGG